MHFAGQLFFFTAMASFVFLAIGLYKPWVMLWWEDTQNRKKVIRLYGAIALIFFIAYLITENL
jgi:hypothetical protein